ncbi:MAG: hypothetical protein J6W64_04890 [Bacilli bacterium]|nr:hypothetical protein [Bacilli bacterium]
MNLFNILTAVTRDSRGIEFSCGTLTGFDGIIPYITHLIVLIIKIGVPILLIIFGMLDLGKAVVAQKDDEIKKGQQTFFKRVIAAILVFFVVTIVQLVIGFASGKDEDDVKGCIECFINGDCTQKGAANNSGNSGNGGEDVEPGNN